MYTAIKNFAQQFAYKPKIKNGNDFQPSDKFVIAGMGGSHLGGDILKTCDPALDCVIHSDYRLPQLPDIQERTIVASSYSGNTEETIDAYHNARKQKLSIITIATGEKLLDLAKRDGTPYIQLPQTGVQPRAALGFSSLAMAYAMGRNDIVAELGKLATTLKPLDFEDEGKALAKRLRGSVPIVYASTRNRAIAYNWKIKFNETGKIPAFYNVFPELNHNEMTGFDVAQTTEALSRNFYIIILKDKNDDSRIQKRMEVLAKLYGDRGLAVETQELSGKNRFYTIFASLVLADFAAYFVAENYSVEAELVPMVEEFKKLIA